MKLRWIIFGRTILECLKRSVTPFLMYMFCSMTALACLNIQSETVKMILVAACILLAVVLNIDMAFSYGKKHYQMYLSGNIRRNNNIDTYNNKDRKSYRFEMEYRPYKGFLIGFFVGIPVVLVCVLYALFGTDNENGNNVARLVLIMVSGWAILPWELVHMVSSPYITLISCILPIVFTGVTYILGAMKEKKTVEDRNARIEAVNHADTISNRQKKKQEREKRNF